MRVTVLIALLLAASKYSAAQALVTGTAVSQHGPALSKASIEIFLLKDSALYRQVVADSAGLFIIGGVAPGRYFIKVSAAAHNTKVIEGINIAAGQTVLNTGAVVLSVRTVTQQEASITGQSRPLEFRDNTVVWNLKNSVTASGSTVLDVLSRMPSVSVNLQNNQISANGKEGVTVLINGKRTYMPQDALFQFLSGMNADNIEKIEVLSSASSEYDAEGKAGIINIILKRGRQMGVYGNAGLQTGFGRGFIAGANGDFSIVKRNFLVQANYSFGRFGQEQLSFNERNMVYTQGLFYSATNSIRSPVQTNHNVSVAFEASPSQQLITGGSFSAFSNRWEMNAVNTSSLKLPQQQISLLNNTNHEINHWKHGGGNLYIKRTSLSKVVQYFSVDYLRYEDDNPAGYEEKYIAAPGQPAVTVLRKTEKRTPIEIFAARCDFTLPSAGKWQFKAGAKSSFSQLANAVSGFIKNQNIWTPDPSITSTSSLTEKILAFYADTRFDAGENTVLRGGLRYEYTDLSMVSGKKNKNTYSNLFPSLLLTHRFNTRTAFSVSASRRINRPSFPDLAPFVLFIDPFTLFTGNSSVTPSVSNNAGIGLTLGNMQVSASFSSEKNALSRFQISVDTAQNMQIVRPENLELLNTFNTTVILPISAGKRFQIQNTAGILYQHIKTGALLGNRNLNRLSVQASSTALLKLSKGFSIELSGFWNSAVYSGGSDVQPLGGFNCGIRKSFSKGSLTMNFSDVFNTIRYTSLVTGKDLNISNGFDFSQPTIKITASVRLGKHPASGNIKRSQHDADERKRVE